MTPSQILLCTTPDGDIRVDTVLQNATVWLTQGAMAELFDVQVPAISKHLANIYEEGELTREATVSKMETVQDEGGRQVKRTKDFYNLDAIIAVGYRVNSKRATTGHTAAELIESRSNPELPNMGLTSWQGSKVRKQDVTIAKNYLKAEEVKDLNEIVTMYLDYAERQARLRKTVTMDQWSEKLDAFLAFNEHELLTHAGHVKAAVAQELAERRYEVFDHKRKTDEARAADKEDLRELEEWERRMLEQNKP